MKRKTSLILITLLVALALTFSQGFAAGPTGKKTPVPNAQPPAQESQPDKPDSEKHDNADKSNNGNQYGKDGQPGKPDKPDKDVPPGQDKKADKDEKDHNGQNPKDEKPKDEKPDKGEKQPKAHDINIHLRGTISGFDDTSITIDLGKNQPVTLLTDGAELHVSGGGKAGEFAGWAVGMEITAKTAAQPDDPNTYQAISIHVVPGAPTHFHRVGRPEALTVNPDGTGSLTINGQTVTITPDTVILPKGAEIKEGALLTVICSGDELTARAVVVHPK